MDLIVQVRDKVGNEKINPRNWAVQYEAIRRSGLTNMFDQAFVQEIAHESEFHDLVVKIDEWDSNEYLVQADKARTLFGELPEQKLPDVQSPDAVSG